MSEPAFTEEELAALPRAVEQVIRLRRAGVDGHEIKRRTGYFLHQQDALEEHARRWIEEEGLEALRAQREEYVRREAWRDALGVLPNWLRNLILRSDFTSAEQLRRTSDAQLLRIRGMGTRGVALIRTAFSEERIDPREAYS
jgi:hypothetical protein